MWFDAKCRRVPGILSSNSLLLQEASSSERYSGQRSQESPSTSSTAQIQAASSILGDAVRGDGALCHSAVPQACLYSRDRLIQTHLQKGKATSYHRRLLECSNEGIGSVQTLDFSMGWDFPINAHHTSIMHVCLL